MDKLDNSIIFSSLNGKSPQQLFSSLPSPCYIIDESQLKKNCEILASVMKNTGCKILLAQKAFSNFNFYSLLSNYLVGTEASGLFEAKLGYEEMPNKEVHVFSCAYCEDEFLEILKYADHIVFNSPNQLKKFGALAKKHAKSVGLRINPECSTQDHKIYDPCAEGSRLGTTRSEWDKLMTSELISLLDGLHFHTLCEQDADDLAKTLQEVEKNFADILPKISWLNFGGGHHITRKGYDIKKLEVCIKNVQQKWNVQVYLEPGEACALNAGFLLSRVLDIVTNNKTKIAILDTSPTCHTPDVIEMPYTPPLYNAKNNDNSTCCYTLAGPSCLAGDVIGKYSFEKELKDGDILLFGDMAIYSTCKNNTFNGMPLPNIYKWALDGTIKKLTDFGYNDFKNRLGKN